SSVYKVYIDDIELLTSDDPGDWGTKPLVDIVNTAEDLDAALERGSSVLVDNPVGRDIIFGGDGDDIIFGDAINTEGLPWGQSQNPEKPENLKMMSGLDQLKFFLAKGGSIASVTDDDVYDYIKDNHEQFNVEGDK